MLFKKKYCPVCESKLTLQNISNAMFDGKYRICTSCIEAINNYFGGEKNQDIVFLEDLKKIVNDYYNSNRFNCYDHSQYFDNWYKLQQQYETALTQHFQLLAEIEEQYSIAVNQDCIDNRYTDKCLKLCIRDISLASNLYKFWERESKIMHTTFELPHYSSFEKSAKLLEKLNQYEYAINICIYALKLGFTKDGSKGGLKGRLARLLKKYNKLNNTYWRYDYDENVIYDAETGEVTKKFEQKLIP